MKWLAILLLLVAFNAHAKTEAEYVVEGCTGEVEHRLSDGTRIDCLTEEYAFEYDYCRKWAEAIGQSLHYARMSGKKPAVALICNQDDQRFIDRIVPLAEDFNIHLIFVEREQ